MPSARAAAARAARCRAERIERGECPECGGPCLDPDPAVADRPCPVFDNRFTAMLDAYPDGALYPVEIDPDNVAAIEYAQLAAFEAGVADWWQAVPGPDGGTGHGKVVKKLTSETHIKDHKVAASEDDPQYLVEAEDGVQAAHKPSALTKDD